MSGRSVIFSAFYAKIYICPKLVIITVSSFFMKHRATYCITHTGYLTLSTRKIDDFANRADLDDVAHNEPPHQELHCLPYSL